VPLLSAGDFAGWKVNGAVTVGVAQEGNGNLIEAVVFGSGGVLFVRVRLVRPFEGFGRV